MAKRKKSYSTPQVERMSGQRYVQESYKEGPKQHRAASKWYTKAKARENANNGVSSEKKALNYQKKGSRSYRPTPQFGGTVFGLVSIILVIGILASMFFVVQNIGRPIGKPFTYFSPSVFLNNISSPEIVVSEGSYTVETVLQEVFPSWNNRFWGYITVNGRRYKSTTAIYVHDIDKEEYQFYFDLGGDLYGSHFEYPQGPTIGGEPLPAIRVVDLPSKVFQWNNPPDLNEVLNSWEEVAEEGSLFDALSATAGFGLDFFRYQANLLSALLPWNSSVSSDSIPEDGVKVDIPWRGENMEFVTGVITD